MPPLPEGGFVDDVANQGQLINKYAKSRLLTLLWEVRLGTWSARREGYAVSTSLSTKKPRRCTIARDLRGSTLAVSASGFTIDTHSTAYRQQQTDLVEQTPKNVPLVKVEITPKLSTEMSSIENTIETPNLLRNDRDSDRSQTSHTSLSRFLLNIRRSNSISLLTPDNTTTKKIDNVTNNSSILKFYKVITNILVRWRSVFLIVFISEKLYQNVK